MEQKYGIKQSQHEIHQGSCEANRQPKLYNFLTSHEGGQLRPELNN